ncbi:MAG: acylphosphatase [Gammaproteobacteria bacterium]
MSDDDTVVRCIVSGRVQGVWYRASTKNKALELGLRGIVRNLSDGNVEVILAGRSDAVMTMCRWLWEGPPGAQVSGVTVAECDEDVGLEFLVG